MTDDAKRIFSYRLRQARTMKGWSLRQLADETEGSVSHNALARYERGEMMPGSAVLMAVAKALSQPVDFFFRQITLSLGKVSFRKKSTLGIKAEEAIRESATSYFERYFEIEQITGDGRPFTGKLDGVVSSPDDVEAAAVRLREKWELGSDPIPNVIELAESHGMKVYEAPADEKFDGFSAVTEAGPIIVLASWLSKNVPRKRMTTAHEIGHLVLTLPEGLDEKAEEAIMKPFAGAFLLPEKAFRDAFGPRRSRVLQGDLIEMKGLFGVSMMAIMMRAKGLDLISESTAKSFFFMANKKGWRKHGEPGDERYHGQENHSRFRRLVCRAAADGKISLTKGASLLDISLGDFRTTLGEDFS